MIFLWQVSTASASNSWEKNNCYNQFNFITNLLWVWNKLEVDNGCFKKKIAQKVTLELTVGRGVKNIPFFYLIKRGTYIYGGRGQNTFVPCPIREGVSEQFFMPKFLLSHSSLGEGGGNWECSNVTFWTFFFEGVLNGIDWRWRILWF